MWTRHGQQQQRGAQLPARERIRREGSAPAEATRDRGAQAHDLADLDAGGGLAPPGGYPASRIETTRRDNTPSAPEPAVDWDAVVQPERAPRDGQPLPEGRTELEQDESDRAAER